MSECQTEVETTYDIATNEALISAVAKLRYELLRIDENDPTTHDRARNAKKTLQRSVNMDFLNGIITRAELINELRDARQCRE